MSNIGTSVKVSTEPKVKRVRFDSLESGDLFFYEVAGMGRCLFMKTDRTEDAVWISESPRRTYGCSSHWHGETLVIPGIVTQQMMVTEDLEK